jgi:CRISPR/Cas system-associated protein Cas7 (RAMP superfamily)
MTRPRLTDQNLRATEAIDAKTQTFAGITAKLSRYFPETDFAVLGVSP